MNKVVLLIALSVLAMSSALLADEPSPSRDEPASSQAENATTFALVGGHIVGYGKAPLIVRDGRIEQIASAAPNSTLRRVNADGRYIAPAFIDSHVHLAYRFSAAELTGINPHEIELLVKAGLDNKAILAAGTTIPAQFWGFGDGLGTLAAGHSASLLILDADPERDPLTLSRPLAVYLDGLLMGPSTAQ